MTHNQMPQSPGSMRDFMSLHPDKDPVTVAEMYGAAGTAYRQELAAYHGIDLEDLHAMKFRECGAPAMTVVELEPVQSGVLENAAS